MTACGIWSALQGVGYADTDKVRTYLLERLQTERDAGLYMSIAAALGQMKEQRGIEQVGQRILRFQSQWNGAEPHLRLALHQMNAGLASPRLERYVVHEQATRFRAPLGYSARVDGQKASDLATQIIRDRQCLNDDQLNDLKQFADHSSQNAVVPSLIVTVLPGLPKTWLMSHENFADLADAFPNRTKFLSDSVLPKRNQR